MYSSRVFASKQVPETSSMLQVWSGGAARVALHPLHPSGRPHRPDLAHRIPGMSSIFAKPHPVTISFFRRKRRYPQKQISSPRSETYLRLLYNCLDCLVNTPQAQSPVVCHGLWPLPPTEGIISHKLGALAPTSHISFPPPLCATCHCICPCDPA